jgi:hypothetical protein
MTAEAVPGIDASHYTAQYELLRSQVIGARWGARRSDAVGQAHGVGLALLLREGISGWLKAVEAVFHASVTRRAVEAAGSAAVQHPAGSIPVPAWLCNVPRHDLTALLTNLVLSTRAVQHTSPREGSQSCH